MAFHVGVIDIGHQYDFLALKRKPPTSGKALRGSLGATIKILTYFGTPTHGASGAPVMAKPGKVIAIHEAGFDYDNIGWAILIPGSGDDLRSPQRSRIEDVWPSFTVPLLAHSGLAGNYDTDALKVDVSRVFNHNLFSLTAGLVAQPQFNMRMANSFGETTRLRYTYHAVEAQTSLGYFKFGILFDFQYDVTGLPRMFRAPNGAILASDSIEGRSMTLGFGFDFRMERLNSEVSPILSLTASAGGWTHVNVPNRETDDVAHFAGGLAIDLMNRNPIGRLCTTFGNIACLHFIYGLRLSKTYTPNLSYTYTGVGASYTRGDDSFALHAVVHGGLEW